MKRQQACVLGIVILLFGGLWILIGRDRFSLDYDEGVYLLTATSVVQGNSLYSHTFCSQPPLFSQLLAFAFDIFGKSVFVGRLLAVGFNLLALVAVAGICFRVAGFASGLIAVLSLGIYLSGFWQSLSCQPDVPSLTFGLLSLWIAFYHKHSELLLVALSGAIFGLALMFKLLVAPLLGPIIFILCLSSLECNAWQLPHTAGAWRLAIKRVCLHSCAALIMCLIVLLCFDFGGFYEQSVQYQFASQAIAHQFEYDRSKVLHFLSRLLLYTASLNVLAVVGFICLSKINPLASMWLAIWGLMSFLFIMTRIPLWKHHLVIVLIPLAVCCGQSTLLLEVSRKLRKFRFVLVHAITTAIVVALFGLIYGRFDSPLTAVFSPHQEAARHSAERAIELITRFSNPDSIIVTDEPMIAFRCNRPVPPWLCDTSNVRIQTGFLTDAAAIEASRNARLIILSSHRLEKLTGFVQWVEAHFHRLSDTHSPAIYVVNSDPLNEH